MARIKKRGLDYFPVGTDFIYNRAVRRLMKREGDASLAILLEALTYIYAGEGYYVRADSLFYEDLSAGMYEETAADVERVVRLAVEYGLFDAGLFAKFGILTSADIQKQYLFSTRRRTTSTLEASYCLLDTEEQADEDGQAPAKETIPLKEAAPSEEPVSATDMASPADTVTLIPQNVTLTPVNVTSCTHSIAQHSIAQDSKEYPHFYSPPEKTGEKEKAEEGEEEIFSVSPPGGTAASQAKKRSGWTREAIDALVPPSDGTPRNYAGLLDNLRNYGIPLSEQYALIRKSDFGAIGGPVWRGLATLHGCGGKIKLPGRYLLSVVNKKENAEAY